MSYNLSSQVKLKLAGGVSPSLPALPRAGSSRATSPDLKALLVPVLEEMVDDRFFKVITNLGQRPQFSLAKTASGSMWTVLDLKEDSARFIFYVEGDDVSLIIKPDSLTSKFMGPEERSRVRLGTASNLPGLRIRLEVEIVLYAIEKIRVDYKRLSRGRCQIRDRPYLNQLCEVLDVAAPYYG